MTAAGGPYAGLDRFEARKRVVADLEALGLLEKIEDYTLSLGNCERCKTVVEPLVSTQWFVRPSRSPKKPSRRSRPERIEFIPENWIKTYNEWMYNIRDWCISRQLWWGHRIPAWYCDACGEIIVAREAPASCPRADRRSSCRIPTCSTPGSAPASGPSPRSAGPTKPTT